MKHLKEMFNAVWEHFKTNTMAGVNSVKEKLQGVKEMFLKEVKQNVQNSVNPFSKRSARSFFFY